MTLKSRTINKKLLVSFAIFALVFTCRVTSQSIDESLTQAYSSFESAKTYSQYLVASNQFKTVAKQNPASWIANYYAAWSIATISFQETNKGNKDLMLDEADGFFKKIERMDSSNDEIAVLGGLLAQARAAVAPEARHGKYGAIANAFFATAKKLNPDNPRIYFLQANSFFYTPKLLGGGVEKALPLYNKAQGLFEDDPAAMVRDIHNPFWGKEVNESMIKQCKEKK